MKLKIEIDLGDNTLDKFAALQILEHLCSVGIYVPNRIPVDFEQIELLSKTGNKIGFARITDQADAA